MADNEPRSLADLLKPGNSGLGRLARQASEQSALAEVLRAGLPAELAAALLSASLRPDGTLVVTASSPAWAARLRFESAALLESCRQRAPAAARLKVRVNQLPPQE